MTDSAASGPAAPRADTDPDTAPDPRRWKALSVTLTAGFMSLLDVSIVAVALPSIQHGLGTSPAAVQWVVSGYTLTYGLALVPAGRLGDAFGRRRVFLVALTGFVVCSAACGAAPSAAALVAARLAQGVAAGSLAPQNSGLIQQLFTGDERGRAFGWFGATVGLSTAIGPVVGGAILTVAGEADGWRWIFYVNMPIGIAALVLAARLVPGRPTTAEAGPATDPGTDAGSGAAVGADPGAGAGGRARRIDVLGVLLLGSGVLALMLPLVEADSGGLRTLWWLFGVGAVLLAVFGWWERRLVSSGGAPLVDVTLLTHIGGYGSGVLLGTAYFAGFSGIWLVFAIYFQGALGYTPLRSGLSVTPFALGSACSAVVGGRLVARMGRLLTVTGTSLVVLGLVASALVLLVVPGPWAGWAVAPALLVAGIGGGWVISPNNTLTLSHVPPRMAGSAGGALQTGQRIGASIGTAGLTAVLYTALAASGRHYPTAVALALGAAAAMIAVALVIAVIEWRRARSAGW